MIFSASIFVDFCLFLLCFVIFCAIFCANFDCEKQKNKTPPFDSRVRAYSEGLSEGGSYSLRVIVTVYG